MGLFLKCRHAYHYRWHLHLVPRIELPQLREGTLCHAGMRAGLFAQYGGQTMPDAISSVIFEMWDEWQNNAQIKPLLDDDTWQESADMRDKCTSVVLRAFDNLGITAGRWETQTLKDKPLIEYELEDTREAGWRRSQSFGGKPIMAPDCIQTTGTLDWVARDTATGHVWLVDWKFRKGIVDDDAYDDPNSQAAGYQHLLAQRGLVLNGTATGQIRRSVPNVPTINKGKGAHQGKMSRAPRSTDWPTYRDACIEAGLDPDDYLDVRDKLKPFEKLTFNYRGEKEVAAMWKNSIRVSAEMADVDLDYPYRSMSPHNCRGCEYREPCLEELRGGDVKELRNTLFMHPSEQPASWAYHPADGEPEGEEDDDYSEAE